MKKTTKQKVNNTQTSQESKEFITNLLKLEQKSKGIDLLLTKITKDLS